MEVGEAQRLQSLGLGQRLSFADFRSHTPGPNLALIAASMRVYASNAEDSSGRHDSRLPVGTWDESAKAWMPLLDGGGFEPRVVVQ